MSKLNSRMIDIEGAIIYYEIRYKPIADSVPFKKVSRPRRVAIYMWVVVQSCIWRGVRVISQT